MNRNLLIVSLLAAALSSGVALAKSGGGTVGSGPAMGGSSKSLQMGKDEDCNKANQAEQAKRAQGTPEEAARKALEQERERLKLQQESAGTQSSEPAKIRTEEQTPQENAVQP